MGMHDGHRANMRQRFLSGGLEGFAPHEALELLLYYAIPRRDVNALAHQLIDRYGSLAGVFRAPVEDLQKVPGIGENAAVLLSLVQHISRKASLDELDLAAVPLTSSQAMARYFLPLFQGRNREVVYQVCVDQKGKLLSCKKLSDGTAFSAQVEIRQVGENAILYAASGVALAHNHPSGIATPSDGDLGVTRRVREALDTIGVPLLDHIIVADGDYVSLADSGLL